MWLCVGAGKVFRMRLYVLTFTSLPPFSADYVATDLIISVIAAADVVVVVVLVLFLLAFTRATVCANMRVCKH